MMSKLTYSISELFSDDFLGAKNDWRFVIPQYQRGYKWGEGAITKLLNDIDKFDVKGEDGKFYCLNNLTVVERADNGIEYYVVDGQQRLTTLTVILACLKHFDDQQTLPPFEAKIDYNIREKTKEFLSKLVNNDRFTIDGEDIAFYELFSSDKPIPWEKFIDCRNDFDYQDIFYLFNAYNCIHRWLKEHEKSRKDFTDKLLYHVKLIVNNVSDVENEATLFGNLNSNKVQLDGADIISKSNQIDFGQKWEEWQNLFWWHRTDGKDFITKKENADKGFNNYLHCIQDFEQVLNKQNSKINYAEINYELYVNALCLVTNSSCKEKTLEKDILADTLVEMGLPAEWLYDFRNKLWSILNDAPHDWSIGEKTSDAANQKTMLFWPWMYYIKSILAEHDSLEEHLQDLLRTIHLFYLRYYCDKRDYRKIFKVIESICANNYEAAFANCDAATDEEDDDNLFYEEEIRLQKLYGINHEYEKIIWGIQNVPVIRDGSNCGGSTVMSFCDKISSPDDAGKILDFLKNIFDAEKLRPKTDRNILKSVLLFYSTDEHGHEDAFWHVKSDGKYFATEWKRIVRSGAFWRFYAECRDNQTDISTRLQDKRNCFFKNKNLDYNSPLPRVEKAIIYDALCAENNDSIWKNGNIGFGRDPQAQRPTLFADKDELYRIVEYMWYNRYDLPDNWREILQKKYRVTILLRALIL